MTRLRHVGEIDVKKVRNLGLEATADEVFISRGTVSHIQEKHADLGILGKSEESLIDSIRFVLKNADFARVNPQHSEDGIILYGGVGGSYVRLVLILRDEGVQVATLHGFQEWKARKYYLSGKLIRWD